MVGAGPSQKRGNLERPCSSRRQARGQWRGRDTPPSHSPTPIGEVIAGKRLGASRRRFLPSENILRRVNPSPGPPVLAGTGMRRPRIEMGEGDPAGGRAMIWRRLPGHACCHHRPLATRRSPPWACRLSRALGRTGIRELGAVPAGPREGPGPGNRGMETPKPVAIVLSLGSLEGALCQAGKLTAPTCPPIAIESPSSLASPLGRIKGPRANNRPRPATPDPDPVGVGVWGSDWVALRPPPWSSICAPDKESAARLFPPLLTLPILTQVVHRPHRESAEAP
jgi:hypothetical protein